jgi:hypothetical protein
MGQVGVTKMGNDKDTAQTPLRKLAMLTGQRLILLSALVGSASAFLSYVVIFSGIGLVFPFPYLLAPLIVGAGLGAFVAFLVRRRDGSGLLALGVSAFTGIVTPLCLLQLLFLIAGPGEL